MPHLPEDTSPEAWSRYFAMETNNRAWQLAAQPSHTEAEARDMLNAAHASAHHWMQVGTDLNHARAKYLVAEVHALLGMGGSAMALASEVRGFFATQDAPDWELAYVDVIYAHAAAAAGEAPVHRNAYARAVQALAAIADPEDRRIVEQTFLQVPKPAS